MRRKLCVAGCSFSDYTKVDVVYGEILAQKLDYDYIHLAVGGGSNYKTWRTVTKLIIDENLTPNDLLIIQYTGVERDEIWSSVLPEYINDTDRYQFYDTGVITDFKMFSKTWQYHKTVQNFHTLKELHFTSNSFDLEKFEVFNVMFQSMLIYYKIPTIFIEGIRISPAGYDILEEHKKYFFEDSKTQIKDRKYDLTPGDWSHLNTDGHHVYADLLYNHIKSLDIL
jgi:hypothetical protein